jgi:hypothetical protein
MNNESKIKFLVQYEQIISEETKLTPRTSEVSTQTYGTTYTHRRLGIMSNRPSETKNGAVITSTVNECSSINTDDNEHWRVEFCENKAPHFETNDQREKFSVLYSTKIAVLWCSLYNFIIKINYTRTDNCV